ncbi:hypothetical protein [Agarilytica rhodophyticola]|uniref:hypothetical protein n=1 Tax=Agarilytica rhodophyticola TaxID=1737490 RepID=UPI000B346AC2|nr:hypothetical protein [Agarilytica rhodophyticola]
MRVLLLIFSNFILSFCYASEDEFTFGGHVRFNFDHRDWINVEDRARFEFESLKLTVKGNSGPFLIKADYRWYENVDFDTVKYADITYPINNNWKLTAGITKVPFGLLPTVSTSFWFSLNYYLGFEDDYDSGVVLNYEDSNWDLYLGYFFNDEYDKPSTFGRFSFDVADNGVFRNKENGQFNAQANKKWQWDDNDVTTLIGVSYQYGDILNLDTLQTGEHWAYDIHMRHTHGRWKFELEYLEYDYQLAHPFGLVRDRLILSAFNFPFPVASEGHTYLANIVYTLPYSSSIVDSVTCYSEYGQMDSDLPNSSKSIQWVNGCVVGSGKLFVYLDNISGKNMWFSGGSSIGLKFPDSDEWTNRVNLNIGYYF